MLDIGAGTCRYRELFSHCEYRTHDFKKFEGYINHSQGTYGKMDYVSDIISIPVRSESFDVILCTEVLEHVPEPIKAMKEISRILVKEGRVFITSPLGSGLHQYPFHFYGGYTPAWYQHWCEQYNLKIISISPNGGFFKHLAQECARVSWIMPSIEHLLGDDKVIIKTLFKDLLPRFLFEMDRQHFMGEFTVGYHVEAEKTR